MGFFDRFRKTKPAAAKEKTTKQSGKRSGLFGLFGRRKEKKESAKAPTNSELKKLKKRIDKANDMLADAKKAGYGNSYSMQLALKQHAKARGEKSAERFEFGKAATDRENYELVNRQLDKFFKSKWITEKGRKEIAAKARATLLGNERLNLSENNLADFYEIMSTDTVKEFMTAARLSSDQLVNEFVDQWKAGKTNEQIEQSMRLVLSDIAAGKYKIDSDARLRLKDKMNELDEIIDAGEW